MKQTVTELWKESLGTLKGKSGLVMLYSTLQSTKRGLHLMLTKFWWLLIIDCLIHIDLAHVSYYGGRSYLGFAMPFPTTLAGSGVGLMIYYASKWLLSFAIIFSVRASLEKKDFKYFTFYSSKLWGYLLLFIIYIFLSHHFFPLHWLAAFFYGDSQGGREDVVTSLINGAKATWYFLPISLLLWIAECILDYKIGWLLSTMAFSGVSFALIGLLRFLLYFISVTFMLSMTASWYLKVKHAYHPLFFAKK